MKLEDFDKQLFDLSGMHLYKHISRLFVIGRVHLKLIHIQNDLFTLEIHEDHWKLRHIINGVKLDDLLQAIKVLLNDNRASKCSDTLEYTDVDRLAELLLFMTKTL